MKDGDLQSIVKFSEQIFTDSSISEKDILSVSQKIYSIEQNMSIYKGILSIFYFFKFKKNLYLDLDFLLTNKIFLKCSSLLDGYKMKPKDVGDLFFDILKPQTNSDHRDVLLGCFFGSLWSFMNDPQNTEISSDYGVEIAKIAFSIDQFDIYNKIKIKDKDIRVVSMAGSGKKDVKLLNISTMASVITAVLCKKFGYNIVLAKTIARATSSISGSADVFEIVGVNLNISQEKMLDIMLETGLGVFNINNIVPKLNSIYDGKLHNVQVFAGLVGGAAIVSPINADLINYGLTRGSTKTCLQILSKIYPEKNIIVLQGENLKKESVVDQMSIDGSTQLSMRINGIDKSMFLTPKDFGFESLSVEYLKTGNSKEENLKKFANFLKGCGGKELEQIVSMEVSVNLFGLGVINDFKKGADMAIEIIRSGSGIKLIEDLVVSSGGDLEKFNRLVNL
jgi:anthranilate phosphoribosyltransferase